MPSIPYDQMADRAEEAFEILKKDLEGADKAKKIGRMEKMMLNAFGDVMKGAFTLAPEATANYAEKMLNLLTYVLGYSDSPTGE